MKDKMVISNDLLNDIFYKIPEIHIHHTVKTILFFIIDNDFLFVSFDEKKAFLISISQKLSQWDNKQTVGDLFLQTVIFSSRTIVRRYFSSRLVYKSDVN